MSALEQQLRSLSPAQKRRLAEALNPAPAPRVTQSLGMSFSVMFFADADRAANDKYALFLESVTLADSLGFEAVWLPERHFHAFGGLYPNPAVLAAAVAVRTQNLRIRAGSVVTGLHHPVRIAEDWCVVDNLCQGRVDLAFAAGWNANDFVLGTTKFAERHTGVLRDMHTVQRLWRGESVTLPNGRGEPFTLAVHPRPVQQEVTCWLTCTQDIATFERAGTAGAHVLTALLFQDVATLRTKIDAYRVARQRAGHDPATGHVTVMLHTYLGTDEAAVRVAVKEPFSRYLQTSVHLWGGQATQLGALSPEERVRVLDYAFDRYYRTAALFGTPETCRPLLASLEEAGVQEVACLIDFSMPHEETLESLRRVATLRPEVGRGLGDFYDKAHAIMRPEQGGSQFLTFGMLEPGRTQHAWLPALANLGGAGDLERTLTAQQVLRSRLFAPLADGPAPRAVLDFGCGYGSDLLALAKRFTSSRLQGFSLSPEQVRCANARLHEAGVAERARAICANSAITPLSGPYDLILGFEVAVYIADKTALFARLGRACAPGARLLLAELVALGKHALDQPEISSFIPTAQGWAKALAAGGFRLQYCEDVSSGVGAFLNDPQFETNLATVRQHHPLSENAVAHLWAHHRLGEALRTRQIAYLALAAERVADDSVAIEAHNQTLLLATIAREAT